MIWADKSELERSRTLNTANRKKSFKDKCARDCTYAKLKSNHSSFISVQWLQDRKVTALVWPSRCQLLNPFGKSVERPQYSCSETLHIQPDWTGLTAPEIFFCRKSKFRCFRVRGVITTKISIDLDYWKSNLDVMPCLGNSSKKKITIFISEIMLQHRKMWKKSSRH